MRKPLRDPLPGLRRMRLGAVFAGGQSRRFGSDKAVAAIDGVALIARVIAALAAQADRVVIVGRAWPGLEQVDDLPSAGLGPLGALAGALAHARANGFAEIVTSGCDLPDIPGDLGAILAPGPAVIAGQPLLGLWPAALAEPLLRYLERGGDRAMRGWIAEANARRVAIDRPVVNINTRDDLDVYLRTRADPRSSR